MALCQEVVRYSYENKGRTGLVGAPTYPMLRDATVASLCELLDDVKIAFDMNKSTNTMTIPEVGSRILFRSLDEYERLRGTSLAWFGVDELTYVPEQAWLRLEARLRDPKADLLGGFGVGTPNGFDWVYRRFRADPVKGSELIEAKPFENRHVLDRTPDYYERLQASYDEQFYRQEVLGEFVNTRSGQVYYGFERKEHVGQFELQNDAPLLWTWDFNLHPMCSLICQQKDDAVYVLDEIVLDSSSTPEVCDEFLVRYGEHSAGLQVYGDATAKSRQTSSGLSDHHIIRDFITTNRRLKGKFMFGSSNPAVRDRVNTVNARLRNASGERRLAIDEKCKELIQDLEQVCYKPGSSQLDKDSDSRRTHLSDALGYLLWQEFRPLRHIGERKQRLV